MLLSGLSSVHAAEVGAPACAVFGSGAAAQVHCGVVKKTSSAVTEVAWSDCPTCEAAAPSALLFGFLCDKQHKPKSKGRDSDHVREGRCEVTGHRS